MSARATGLVEHRLRAILDRIATENHRSRIFLDIDPDGALAAARRAEGRTERRADHAAHGPLSGKIVAVKANLSVEGLPWSAGIAGWRDRIAGQDAGAVARLRAAGAIILGTVNMDEGALGAVCDNPTFGRCLNPLDPERSPGGSSGGSAAAVAAGLADLALGTDTMGSIRIPAAYCGLAGLKPTRGLIGRAGLAYLSPSLDSIGPLAPLVRTLDTPLRLLAGFDREDPDSHPAPLHEPRPLKGARLGLPRVTDCDAALLADLTRVRHAATRLGARCVEIDMDGWQPGPSRRAGLLLAEAEAAMTMAGLLEQPGAISPGFAAALAYGRDAPSGKLVTALARIRASAASAHRAMEDVDALLLPTTPQPAVRHGVPPPANQADLTALANFAGLPALSWPVPNPAGGLPGSVQLVGPAFSDRQLIGWGAALQDAVGG